jgi:hypothetical protein
MLHGRASKGCEVAVLVTHAPPPSPPFPLAHDVAAARSSVCVRIRVRLCVVRLDSTPGSAFFLAACKQLKQQNARTDSHAWTPTACCDIPTTSTRSCCFLLSAALAILYAGLFLPPIAAAAAAAAAASGQRRCCCALSSASLSSHSLMRMICCRMPVVFVCVFITFVVATVARFALTKAFSSSRERERERELDSPPPPPPPHYCSSTASCDAYHLRLHRSMSVQWRVVLHVLHFRPPPPLP